MSFVCAANFILSQIAQWNWSSTCGNSRYIISANSMLQFFLWAFLVIHVLPKVLTLLSITC